MSTDKTDAASVDSVVARALFVGWWSVVALLPIGHVTGLRNTWSVVVVVATLAWLGRDAWRGLPARIAIVALLAWCAASIAWSTTPSISFGKWQTDLLLPLCAYAAAFGYVRRTGSAAPLIGGAITGIGLLALLSLPALLPSQWSSPAADVLLFEPFANVEAPLPVWYPGVGDASMAASLVAAVLVCAPRVEPRVPRACWFAGWLFVAIVVVASNNRNAAIAIPAIAIAAHLLMRASPTDAAPLDLRANWRRLAIVCVALVVVAAGVGALLESSARERLRVIGQPVAADRSALVALTARDTRPMIWAYYAKLAVKAPIVGVGFGRTVPGIHYHTQDDRDLARVEFNAYIHAHNLFLNWWLQTGIVGVALLITVLVGGVVDARRTMGPRGRPALIGLYALLSLMLIRDLTDDFLVFGLATLFWTFFGALGGLVRGDARVTARRAP